jgi:hypothetical protein
LCNTQDLRRWKRHKTPPNNNKMERRSSKASRKESKPQAPPVSDDLGDQIQVPGAEPPLGLLDEARKQKIAEFKKLMLSEEHWTEKQIAYMDDYTLYRYLKARDFNFANAKTMLSNTLQWREEFKPDEITADQMASQVRIGGMYHRGYDKYHRPIINLKVATELDPHTRLQKMQFMIWTIEQAIKRMEVERGVEKMVWVVSCRNYNYKYNGELSFARELLSILQNHYPERLGVLFLFDAPFIFRAFWKVISPFVDQKTLKKVVFVSSTDESRKEILEEYFNLEDLIPIYGGTSDFVFDAEKHIEWMKELEEGSAKEEEGKGKEQKKEKKKKKKQIDEESTNQEEEGEGQNAKEKERKKEKQKDESEEETETNEKEESSETKTD